MTVELAVPASLGPATRLLVVMPGVLRNAGDYRDAWLAWAGESDHLVASPCFDPERWPGRHYTRGPRAGAAVESLAAGLSDCFGLVDRRFDLWGHSAGAQFVHRFPLFRPDAPFARLVAANAGWYTMPDLGMRFPYGLRARFGAEELRRWLAAPLTIMRGTGDVVRDEHLRRTPEAEAQGSNRFARAAAMLAGARSEEPSTRWELVDVPGAAHDFIPMARAAQAGWADLRRGWPVA